MYNTGMGKLFIVSTPIGNLEDITVRAIKTLFSVDVILCEDTRRTGLLMQELTKKYGETFDYNFDRKPMLISYYDEIEEKRLPEVIQLLVQDKQLALVSDAGTPLISDPGFRLVRECAKRHISVVSIPGASAVLAALTSSGFSADRFSFLGYLPEKQSQRLKIIQNELDYYKTVKQNPTYIIYCAPHKLSSTLEDLHQILGNIVVVISRELTKVHEEIYRGTISEAIKHFIIPKGEFVIVFRLV